VVAARLCLWLVMGAAAMSLEVAVIRLLVAGAVRWSVSAAAMWGRQQGAAALLILSCTTKPYEKKSDAHVYTTYLTVSEGHSA